MFRLYRMTLAITIANSTITMAHSQNLKSITVDDLLNVIKKDEANYKDISLSYTLVHIHKGKKNDIKIKASQNELYAESDSWILCTNANYSFALEKANGKYALLGVFPRSKQPFAEDYYAAKKKASGIRGELLPFPLFDRFRNANEYTIGDLLVSQNTRVKSITSSANGATELSMSVEAPKDNAKTSLPDQYVTNYNITMKQNSCLVEKFEVLFGDPNKPNKMYEVRSYNTSSKIDGLFIPDRTERMLDIQGKKTNDVVTYHDVKNEKIPVEILFLSYYGIPEPNFNNTSTRWPYYIFGLVGIFAIGYFAFKRYSVKR